MRAVGKQIGCKSRKTGGAFFVGVCLAFVMHSTLFADNLLQNPYFTSDEVPWTDSNLDRMKYQGENEDGTTSDGAYCMAHRGWWGPMNSSLSQTNISCDTNALYYFRMRGNKRSSDFTYDSAYMKLTFYDSGGSVAADYMHTVELEGDGGYSTRHYGSYIITGAPPVNASTIGVSLYIVQGAWLARWDSGMLYDANLHYANGTIVDEFAYDPHAKMDNFDGSEGYEFDRGYGWSNDWSASSRVWVDDNSFNSMSGYPTNRGNKIKMTPLASGTEYAQRNFDPVNEGTLFAAWMMNFQTGGANRYCGLSFMSNNTSLAFIGDIDSADQRLGLAEYAGAGVSVTSAVALNAGTDYLVVGAYDFTSRELRTKRYLLTDTFPTDVPTSWDATVQVAVGHAEFINGVRLTAGGSSTPGDCYFDELRIAHCWPQLLNDSRGLPYITNAIINGGASLTDAEMCAGQFPVRVDICSDQGIAFDSSTWPFFSPNFDFVSPNGVDVLANESFSYITHLTDGMTLVATNKSHPSTEVISGVYTMRVSAISSNAAAIINHTTMSNGTAMTFTVVDDDTTAPILSGFDFDDFYYSQSSMGSGFHVTGVVYDVESGINTNIRYSLVRGGSTVESGSFTNHPAANGDGTTPSAIGTTLNSANVSTLGDYTLYVTNWNYDVESSIDAQSVTTTLTFHVIADPVVDLEIYGNGLEIVDGDVTPTALDNTFFLTFLTTDTTTHTFRVKNTG